MEERNYNIKFTQSKSNPKEFIGTEKDKRTQLMAAVDVVKESPSSRAIRVHQLLVHSPKELTNWDLICFSAEYLGSQVQALPWMKEAALRMLSLVYTQHYVMVEEDK